VHPTGFLPCALTAESPDRNRYLFSTEAIQQWCFRLIGLDVYMTRWPLESGTFWKVETERHGPANNELYVWAFGWHFIIGRWNSRSRYYAN